VPPAARAGERAFANVRLATAIAATVGLLAGEIVNEVRQRRGARAGRRTPA